MTPLDLVNPPTLGRPSGFSHGIVAPAGARLLFVAGQTAPDAVGGVTGDAFVAQFDAALTRTLAVVREAGGTPDRLARVTLYVTDIDAYASSRPRLGEVWRRLVGTHYPAMTVVQVARLVDAGAVVEVEATAVLS